MSTTTPSIPAELARHLQKGRAERALLVERAAIDEQARTVRMAIASEVEVNRGHYIEVLDCSPGAVRLGRLRAGASFLCDHVHSDVVGTVVPESIEFGADKVIRVDARFGRSVRANEVFGDVVDGIRPHVSVGYLVHGAVLVGERDGLDIYRVTDWEPFEVSSVGVPADYMRSGVGRSLSQEGQPPEPTEPETITPPLVKEETQMTEAITTTAAPATVPAAPAAAEQRNHAKEIAAIAAASSFPAARELMLSAIQSGSTVEQYQNELIRAMANKPLPTANIGLSAKEQRQFSVVRILNSMANPTDQRAREAAGFELEASRAAADKITHREVRGMVIPHDVLTRGLTVGTATAGGHTVATDLLAGDFIELLRNKMVLSGMGMRTLSGLVGNIAIPRITGGATAYWVAEDGTPTASQQAFDQVTLAPKTLGGRTAISRKLLLQSSMDVEMLVQDDLATVLAMELQRAAINGSGTAPEPRGILTTVGIGDVAGGTNGLAPTWAHMVALETAVSVANADVGSLGYLTNAKVRGKLKTTSKVSGQNGFIWEGGNVPLNGYGAAVTNAVPSNLTKGTSSGVCSAIIFGNFSDLIMGMWGGLELQVDPYSSGDNGSVIVRAFQDADVAVRHADSFAAMKDALTV